MRKAVSHRAHRPLRMLITAAVWAVAAAGSARAAAVPGEGGLPNANFRTYDTPYYALYSDQNVEIVREASVRITCMGEAYYQRCRAFGGKIRTKFPLYLFKEASDYSKAGGPGGSAGCYISRGQGGKLLVRSDPQIGDKVWHVVQHEGFHQFVHRMIGGEIPITVNEGMAEYFGHGIWTGDGLVCGVIPPDRLRRVQALLAAGRMSSWRNFFAMDYQQWGGIQQYDQAWSMVQFLVHADAEKYQQPFVGMIADMAKRMPWDKAFVKWLGRDIDGSEQQWRKWWARLPANPTRDLYDQATVETLVSFLARAAMRGVKFETADDFFAAARAGKLVVDPEHANEWNWLPPVLLESVLPNAKKLGEWSIAGSPPSLAVKRADGKVFTGTYRLQSGARPEVTVTVK